MGSASRSLDSRLHARWLAVAIGTFLSLVLLATPTLGIADEPPPPDTTGQDAVPGQLIVGFDQESTAAEQRKAVNQAGAKIDERVDLIDGAVIVTKKGRSTDEVADALSQADPVKYVEPNYIVRSSRLPNDVSLSRLWGLHNTGQFGGRPGADISAPAAWDVSTGGDVTVAVLDTGIDYHHPDLGGNLWTNPGEIPNNGRDDDGNGFVDDVHGYDFYNDDSDPTDDASHGTHVAGIIGAEGNNGIGTVGVDWTVHMMALKFLDKNGDGSTADAAKAIDYAITSGARVVNASWGGPAYSRTLYEAVKHAGDLGVLFVAAAGNDGVDADRYPDYPAAFDLPNVVSVAASDSQDKLADFSNYGARTVDLAAPGDEIYSTVPLALNPTGYETFSGTSMAAPYVTGASALYLSRNPGSSMQQVHDALLRSVDPLPSLAGKTVTGGRLNLAKLMGAGQPAAPAPAAPAAARDTTRPSRFYLLRPRNRYRSHRRAPRFRWQQSRDASGIRVYRLYVDGKKRKTLRDPDGPGGRQPRTSTKIKLRGGRHRWTVRAYDYAGNFQTATLRDRRLGAHRLRHSSLLYIQRRR